jgi:conjugative relaxase-like TrwC/TraI family protein
MVATIFALKSAAAAASYYENDDYYSEKGDAPSEWFGKGAAQQGLSGDVDRAAFVQALDGITADGEQLGTMREGELQHRAGWDMTFSAPKSVSIMAEVAGDRRLIAAHDTAVRAALSYVEEHGAATRIRTGGKVGTVETGSLTAAVFRHDTSRELDPQLHSHGVILNMTKSADGAWRSLESREMYRLYMNAGAVYRQSLASEAARLGYGIEQGKNSLFELKGVSKELIDAFSTRSKQIQQGLEERGKTRETATAQEKGVIALDTRERKKDVDRGQLVDAWRSKAASLGFGENERLAAVATAENKASRGSNILEVGKAGAIANAAVASAARSLSERQSVISAAQLTAHAGDFALGKISPSDIQSAISGAMRRGDLEARRYKDNRGVSSKGYTTREAIATERRLLANEGRGRSAVSPALARADAARVVGRAMLKGRDSGYSWTVSQQAATKGLLQASNRVVGIQGYAGTAKTTTVLATYADTMRRGGYTVRSFAPTANASCLLGDAIGAGIDSPQSRTVAALVHNGDNIVAEARRGAPEAWIIDEASMVSAKDMSKLLELSERANARVVLVGDVKQLGSVEAGRAFGQLQDAGMQVWKLDEIVRQSNVKTREAVLATISGDGRRALEALDQGGGKVVENADTDSRIKQMARDFVMLGQDARYKTLVLDPSREGRDKLTDSIRNELVQAGALGRESLSVTTLEARGLTREEARFARNYEVGDAVTFRRDYDRQGVSKELGYTISSIDADRNKVTLVDKDGRKIDWNLDKWGRGQVQSYAQREKEFRAGDKLQFTQNDRERGFNNGQVVQVINVDLEKKTLFIRDDKGQLSTIGTTNTADQHVRHGWVSTIYSAQGATAQKAMVHLESYRANTVDAKSAYVALSRAKDKAMLYTDDRNALSQAISQRSGEKQSAQSRNKAPEKSVIQRMSDWVAKLGEALTGKQSVVAEKAQTKERGSALALG